MKWVKIQTFKRFALWKNIKIGIYERFWLDINPNYLKSDDDQEDGKMEVVVNTINLEYRFKNVSNIVYDENHIAIYYYKENSCLDGKKTSFI